MRLDRELKFSELKKFKREVGQLLEPKFISSLGNEDINKECE